MKLDDFDYDLPEDFIAQTPLASRDHSKLMVHNRATNKTEIRQFFNILDYLKKGDVLVLNTTRVIPARLFGIKQDTGAKIEIFLIKKLSLDTYETLVKPLKRLRIGDRVNLSDKLCATLVSKNEEDGTAIMSFKPSDLSRGSCSIEAILEEIGTVPLPHYITEPLEKSSAERYQTVYSQAKGSVAAPTAGLHWTPELMDKARAMGVIFAEVILHVGLGTFRPVKCETVEEHKMHSEYFEIPAATAEIVNCAKAENRRVICVGTTSLRTLESAALPLKPICGETNIFIYPPYKFKVASALITNFHLPKSTLLMLVSAFAGREKVLELYELAKANNFRFFSFGDCMFIE